MHPAKSGLRFLIVCICTFFLFEFVSLYLSWPKQAVLGGLTVLAAITLNQPGKSRLLTLTLMLLSIAVTLRYGWWRARLVIGYFSDESNHRFSVDAVLMLILLSAEIYTVCIMVLGYMQTCQRLQRRPVPLPHDESLWPHVDVLIPTYNEPLSLVRYTALAAINIDYPTDKLHVYILDDGTREEFRAFAEEAGVGYVVRENHDHAKAGNINHALKGLTSPLVSIFDCDHVPTRSFLQLTVGWFLVENKLAMLQTPHFFYSPDPFERNLQQYKSIPNEGELFYGIIQDGNDLWNATFFCGSCAVIRRSALDEVGGIATETVTEDAHTSLRMQKRGWSTGYINIAQAAGLATETLAGHIGQRVRWARGMIQILRTENPLLARGMNWAQRLCYFNAMMHFMYAVPRLIFLLAPLAYMLAGRTIIPGYWLAILAYALPHLIISNMTNSRVQGEHRHSFWNEIYETVLAPYILLPTVLAFINPKLGKFNVTDKGTTLQETRFDRKVAAPTTWLLLLNFAGVLAAPYRYLVLDPEHPGVVLSNLFWILFNIVILGVAAAVAHEQKQRRASVRIPLKVRVLGKTAGGVALQGETEDMSVGGASILLTPGAPQMQVGETFQLSFPAQTGASTVTTTVTDVEGLRVRAQFSSLSLEEEETLTCALYSRADSWLSVRERAEVDRPLVSFCRIMRLSVTGLHQVLLGLLPRRKRRIPVPAAVARTASILLFCLLTLLSARASAQHNPLTTPANSLPVTTTQTPAAAAFRLRFKDMGVTDEVEFRGSRAYYSLHFVLPHTSLPKSAQMFVGYRFSPKVSGSVASIQIALNGTPLQTLTPETPYQKTGAYRVTPITIPAELLIRDNELTFQFNGGTDFEAPVQGRQAVSASLAGASELVISNEPLQFKPDFALLPLPFFDSGLQNTTNVQFVFPTPPDKKTLQAAGVVASWFGILASAKPIRFHVVIGDPQPGNAVVFVNRSSKRDLLQNDVPGPSLQLRPNSSDPNGTMLVVAGDDGDQLLSAACALSLRSQHGDDLNVQRIGDTIRLRDFDLPAPRKVDDAPRWLPTGKLVDLATSSSQGSLKSDGSKPVPLYFRLPPDLYYGETENLNLQLRYSYNSGAIASDAALRTYINGALINEAPLPDGSGTVHRQRQALLPTANLRPFTNTLNLNFDFGPLGVGSSGQTRAGLLQSASLDLRGLAHWIQLPNLELFANAGFPFTQYADLSHTVVMVPRSPTDAEVTLFLDMLSHFGRQTGYPALRVEVATPGDTFREDRDYLILGSYGTQSAWATLNESLPITLGASGNTLQTADTNVSRALRWFYGLTGTTPADQTIQPHIDEADAIMEGIGSPGAQGRSLVVVALRNSSVEEAFMDRFLDRSQSSEISGTVSLFKGTRFLSYDLDVPRYNVGSITRYAAMRVWLTEHFWVLLGVVVGCSLMLAGWTREHLDSIATDRLQSEHSEPHALA
ncbi:UDP-forming cellulose synthase catalytic subunit [Terriglobus aquaticus]|nr:UDP-forming cellulose synthase catalytic subunit [Terriglobus aquaticus]